MKIMNDPLLRELLETDDLVRLRNQSLDCMLVAVRCRRRRRRIVPICLGLLSALVLAAHLLTMVPDSPVATADSAHPGHSPAQFEEAPSGKVKFITTEELLALFPDRPIALVGPAGQQQLIFLDEPLQEL
jgi:hypothetical protein